MSERNTEGFELDEEFLSAGVEESSAFDRLLDRVDKRRPHPGKRAKAAWSLLEEVLADRKLEKDLRDFDEEL